MKPTRLAPTLAALATLLVWVAPASAQQGPAAPPAPVRVQAARGGQIAAPPAPFHLPAANTTGLPAVQVPVRAMPVLSAPTGLAAPRSTASQGLASTDPSVVDGVLKSVSAISVAAEYRADANAGMALGPVEMKGGADVALNAHFDAVSGSKTPVLDSLDLTASGVDLKGPLGISLPVKHVSVDSKGAITAQLSSWLPSVTIKSVEHKPNGDVVLHGGSWFMPDITIRKDGTVVGPLGVKLGKADARIFAQWPPTLESLGALGAGGGNVNLSQLAGNLKWDVAAKGDNRTLAFGGKVIQAHVDAEVKGSGRLANGRITTLGDANTASVTLKVGPQAIHDDKGNSAALKASEVTLNGKYKLTAPLKDATKNLIVDFDGKASYSVDPTNIHLNLPDGAKVSIGEAKVQGTERILVSDNKGVVAFSDDGTYAAQVKGPIHVENLGPVKSLDLDGTATSVGHDKLVNGGVQVQGNLTGEETVVKAAGIAQRLRGEQGDYQVMTTVKAGTKLNVNLSTVQAALALKLTKSGSLTDVHTDVKNPVIKGSVGGHLALGDTTVVTPNVKVSDSAAEGDVTVGIDSTRGAAAIKGNVKLDAPASVDATQNGIRAHAAIDAGSNLGVDATVATVASGANPIRRINGKILGALGASGITAQGPGLDAKLNGDAKVGVEAPFSATVDGNNNVKVDPTKTTAHLPVTIALAKGSRVSYRQGQLLTDCTLDKDGSYVKVTADFAVDAQGKPVLQDLNDADIFITLGPATATVAGYHLDMQAEKTLSYKGRVVFRPNGIDVYGSAQIGIQGQPNTPIFSVNY